MYFLTCLNSHRCFVVVLSKYIVPLPVVGPGTQQLRDFRQAFAGALEGTAVSEPSWKSLDLRL
jgi:hypothetical protein